MAESMMQPDPKSAAGDLPPGGDATPPADVGPAGGDGELLAGKYKTPEDLVDAYKALESKIGMKEEDLRKVVEEEFTKERFGNRPEKPGDYQLPESVDMSQAGDNQLLDWWSNHAYDQGFSQEQFEKGIEMYRQSIEGDAPDFDAEEKKLGDNAKQRIEAASLFVHKHVPKDSIDAMHELFKTAEGVKAVEGIMQAMRGGTVGDGDGPAPGQLTEAKLREMMSDERYWNPTKRDPNFVKEVEAGFQKLHGDA